MSQKTAIKLSKGLAAAIVLGLLVWLGRSFEVDVNDLRSWILSFGWWAPLVYIVLYTIRPLVFFPASILSIAGGLAFGAWMGTLYTVIGATFGAMLSFYASQTAGKRLVEKQWSGVMAKAQRQMKQNGFLYVLLFRLIPVVNFDLVSYTAAFAKVRFHHFAWATVIGIIPGTFAYNFLGSSFISGDLTTVLLALAVFALLTAVPLWLRRVWNKKQADR